MEVVACWPGAGSPATPCCVPSHTISARRPGPRTVLRPLTMAADAPSDSAARRRRAPEASPTEAAPPQRGATAMAKGGAPSPSWWAGALGENGGDKDTAGGLGSGGGGQGQVAQQWRRGRAAWAAARPHPLPPLPTLPSPPPPFHLLRLSPVAVAAVACLATLAAVQCATRVAGALADPRLCDVASGCTVAQLQAKRTPSGTRPYSFSSVQEAWGLQDVELHHVVERVLGGLDRVQCVVNLGTRDVVVVVGGGGCGRSFGGQCGALGLVNGGQGAAALVAQDRPGHPHGPPFPTPRAPIRSHTTSHAPVFL